MKNINYSAPVKCSKTILINASSTEVWEVITNIDNWANWQTEISKSKLNGSLEPHSSFDWKTGGVKIHSTLHTVEPFNKFGWTGKSLGMTAIHNWALTDIKGQTEVLVEESMEGLLARLFKKPLNKKLEKGVEHWLEFLKIECEK